jgi:uncharacterized RDD family membrane protein YckC
MEYAGFWRRAAAMAIDSAIFGLVQMVLTMGILGGSMAGGASEEAMGGGVMAINLLSIVAMWLYFALMESSSKQATLGKMMIGVIVTDVDGNRISFGRATGRFFGKIVSWIILMIGYLMAAFTQRKQALHDIMAGCLVVRKPKAA